MTIKIYTKVGDKGLTKQVTGKWYLSMIYKLKH